MVLEDVKSIDAGHIETPVEIAHALWADLGEETETASELLSRALGELEYPVSEFVRTLLELGAQSLAQKTRQKLTAPRPRRALVAPVEEWSEAIQESLLDTFEVRPGLLLGDATGADLKIASQAFELKAQDAMVKSRWMVLIGARLYDDQRVPSVVEPDEVVLIGGCEYYRFHNSYGSTYAPKFSRENGIQADMPVRGYVKCYTPQ